MESDQRGVIPMDTFEWCVSVGASGTVPVKVFTAQFDDGYKQVAESGINPDAESWDLNAKGIVKDMLPLRKFLTAHCAKSFLWKNPWGETKKYRVKPDSITLNFVNGNFVELSFTFEQSFSL